LANRTRLNCIALNRCNFIKRDGFPFTIHCNISSNSFIPC
jgi:hypothetical protein